MSFPDWVIACVMIAPAQKATPRASFARSASQLSPHQCVNSWGMGKSFFVSCRRNIKHAPLIMCGSTFSMIGSRVICFDPLCSSGQAIEQCFLSSIEMRLVSQWGETVMSEFKTAIKSPVARRTPIFHEAFVQECLGLRVFVTRTSSFGSSCRELMKSWVGWSEKSSTRTNSNK